MIDRVALGPRQRPVPRTTFQLFPHKPRAEPKSAGQRVWDFIARYGTLIGLLSTSLGLIFSSVAFLSAQESRAKDQIEAIRTRLSTPSMAHRALGTDIQTMLRLGGSFSDLTISCPQITNNACSETPLTIFGIRDDWFPGAREILNVHLDRVVVRDMHLSDFDWRYFAAENSELSGLELDHCQVSNGSFKASVVWGRVRRCSFADVSFEGADVSRLTVEDMPLDITLLVQDIRSPRKVDISRTRFCREHRDMGGLFGMIFAIGHPLDCAKIDPPWFDNATWTPDKPPIFLQAVPLPTPIVFCQDNESDALCRRLALLNGWGAKHDELLAANPG